MRLEPGHEPLVVAELLGSHLAVAAAGGWIGRRLCFRLGALVGLQLAVGDGAEHPYESLVHRASLRDEHLQIHTIREICTASTATA